MAIYRVRCAYERTHAYTTHSSLLDAMRRYIKASQVFKGLGSMLIYLCEHTHSLCPALSCPPIYAITYLRTNEFTQIHYMCGSWQCARAFCLIRKNSEATTQPHTHTHPRCQSHRFYFSIRGRRASGMQMTDCWDYWMCLIFVPNQPHDCGVTFSVGRLI